MSLPLSNFSMYFSSHLNPLKCNLRFFLFVFRLHRIRVRKWRYQGERGMKEEPRKKTLKCKFNLFSRVVIIMHAPRFDLVNAILAHGIYFRMSIIMPYS